MSTLKVDGIRSNSATSDAITLADNGTCTANITNKPNRNLIINGAMQVAQRGTSSTSAGYGTVDRINFQYSGTDEAPTQAQVDVASGTTPYTLGFRKAYKITNGNQTSGAGTADFINFQIKLEAQDVANSGWNYTSSSSFITLSFYIKSSVAQTFKGYLRAVDGTSQQYPFETGSLSADTWTKITKTVSGNSNIQIDNDNGTGFQINIGAFWGTDYSDNSVTENAWGAFASSSRMKDNTSTWYTTNDATLEITGVQLEVGRVATDFEHRSFGEELALCQRYFYQLTKQGSTSDVTNAPIAVGNYDGSSNFQTIIPFPVQMRTNPTLISNNNSNSFYVRRNGGADFLDDLTLAYSTKNCARIFNNTDADGGSGGIAGNLVQETGDSSLAFNAEL